MKNYKKISYLFMSSALLTSSVIPTTIVNAEDVDSKNHNSNVGLEQGDFILKTSEPVGFGSHTIENKKKTVKTGFAGDFGVIDARGTQEGWNVTVSASPFTIIEPENGWIKENPYQLPSGSLSLSSLINIEGVNEEPEKFHPSINTVDTAIDMNEAIKISTADTGKGMGEYALKYNEDALALVIDPLTAKIDTVNYPNSLTPYESNVTWNLISGPQLDENGNVDGENSGGANESGNDNKDLLPKKADFSFNDVDGEQIIELESLKEVTSFATDNDVEVEIVSVEDGKVKIRVIGGTPSGQGLVSGEYIPAQSKEVKNQETEDYIDAEGYTGKLERYVASGEASKTKTVENQDIADYVDAEGYTGTLELYLASGEASKTKSVENQETADYVDAEGYTGTLERYVASGEASKAKAVENQDIADYVDAEGYAGTLERYTASGEASKTKYVTAQASSNYYDAEGYTGTLSQYLASGSESKTKHVTAQVSPNYSDSEGYTGTLNQYLYSGSAPTSKYVSGQQNPWYNDGSYSGTLSQYVTGGSAAESRYMEGTLSGGISHIKQTFGPGYYYPYTDGQFSGNLYLISETHKHHPNGASLTFTYDQYTTDPNDASLQNLNWETIRLKLANDNPNITNIKMVSANWSTGIQTGSFVSDGVTYPYKRTATGTVTADGWEVLATVGGNISKPDTRTFAYAGTVWTADTRVYRYQGNVSTPDTRVYKYQGNVSTPDTRVYKYKGSVSTPDTRVYKYKGNISTQDTRVYKYKGDVSTPDTRVYRYGGTVTKAEVDTRVFKNLYDFNLTIEYK